MDYQLAQVSKNSRTFLLLRYIDFNASSRNHTISSNGDAIRKKTRDFIHIWKLGSFYFRIFIFIPEF
jgi:hypothetical protein